VRKQAEQVRIEKEHGRPARDWNRLSQNLRVVCLRTFLQSKRM